MILIMILMKNLISNRILKTKIHKEISNTINNNKKYKIWKMMIMIMIMMIMILIMIIIRMNLTIKTTKTTTTPPIKIIIIIMKMIKIFLMISIKSFRLKKILTNKILNKIMNYQNSKNRIKKVIDNKN